MPVTIRPFEARDADPIEALCAANSRGRVADPADGFVQGTLTAATITAMSADGGIFVAEDAGRVVAFARSGLPRTPKGPTPAAELMAVAPTLAFRGEPLANLRRIVYGPVVVDADYRGQKIASRLLAAIRGRWRESADVGVLFVEKVNRHSIDVHVSGFGMDCIGEFTYVGRRYLVLAFSI